MESFFSTMKCRILDLVALCPDAGTAIRMALGYVDEYNDVVCQYDLAGLTPSEYYSYVTEGIYPCDSYFGVQASELRPVRELAEDRLRRRLERSEKARERAARRRERAERLPRTAPETVRRDQNRLFKELAKWHESAMLSAAQAEHVCDVIGKTYVAMEFLGSATPELLEELRDPRRWREHEELSYVFDMRELF